ncbi:MAG: ThiF family adenylyltransferase [Planctomycetes bacterium]|nr:ThiF family adenylyltransferase [Planctomycetota bacterium]
MRVSHVGRSGQEALRAARVLLVGCGALGTAIADLLVRAGVGFLRIADRDLVELTNLQRQTLFDERDARESWPKAEAAARRLREVNAEVEIEACVRDVGADELPELARDVDLLLDGTDNFETRYLLNDFAVHVGKPWIYGGAVGDHGLEMAVIPGRTACLRCIFPEPPSAGVSETCETAGVLGPLTALIAALQAADALKILSGHREAIASELLQVELWSRRVQALRIPRQADCACCVRRELPYLDGAAGATRAESLCGRNTVQLRPAIHARIDLERLSARLAREGLVFERSRFWIRFRAEELELTAFPDGRALVHGTDEPARARSFYSRWIGS